MGEVIETGTAGTCQTKQIKAMKSYLSHIVWPRNSREAVRRNASGKDYRLAACHHFGTVERAKDFVKRQKEMYASGKIDSGKVIRRKNVVGIYWEC